MFPRNLLVSRVSEYTVKVHALGEIIFADAIFIYYYYYYFIIILLLNNFREDDLVLHSIQTFLNFPRSRSAQFRLWKANVKM